MAKTWKESRSNITCKCMHSCSKSRIPRVRGSFPKKLTQVTLELYPTQSFRKQIGSFLVVEEHFAALRHSSLDEETSITTNFFSKRQFLKLNTVGQVRKNAIMHISCHYLNSMKPVHLLTMREEPPGIVHCSLSSLRFYEGKSRNFGIFLPSLCCHYWMRDAFLSSFSLLKKKVHDQTVCMAKNVSLWPSGLELYIIEKKKHQSPPKTRGKYGSFRVSKNLKNKNIQQTRKLN